MPNVLNLVEGCGRTPLAISPQGELTFTLDLSPGIYRVRAIIDADRFDWERLYVPMHDFGNSGQRTGPWDFDFEGVRPLLPAWWAEVNGRRLGIAMPTRPSLTQKMQRRMEMRWCFEHSTKGPAEIRLIPHHEFDIKLLHMQVQENVADRPTSITWPTNLADASPARHQATQGLLADWQQKATSKYPQYQQALDDSIALTLKLASMPDVLPLLVFAAVARQDQDAERVLIASVRKLIDTEHWGNPLPDGYGHNGDMGAASPIESLSTVYFWAQPLLEKHGLHEPLRQKLHLQMQRFYQNILLNDGYWGGSLLQDHGMRSLSRFGTASFNMLGVLDEAEHWAGFCITRMRAVAAALPSDGAIPFTSYIKIHLYMDDVTSYRNALLHATGQDMFDDPKFLDMISFVANRLDEQDSTVMCVTPRGDRKDFFAGWGFFNAIAEKFQSHDAARLTQKLLEGYRDRHMTFRGAITLLHAIDHESGVEPRPLSPQEFDYRPDCGMVNYRPHNHNVNISIECPGDPAWSSRLHTTNPCDRARAAHLPGHFALHLGGQAMLLTAEGGYRMSSSLGCVLHVDGKGPFGDDNYSMGYPGVQSRGEHIEMTHYDPETQQGEVRLNLRQAYARESGIIDYRRHFVLEPNRMICRDVVVTDAPRRLSWHFQTYLRRQIHPLSPLSHRIQDGDVSLTLSAQSPDTPLTAAVGPTEVVWAYQNENKDEPFQHIKFESTEAVLESAVDFEIHW